MVINKSNIRKYIDFLHFKKYDIGAKEELLSRWSDLSDFEIRTQLTGLYNHWNIDPLSAQRFEDTFIHSNKQALPLVKPLPNAEEVMENDEGDYARYTKESSSNIPKFIALTLIILAIGFGIIYFFKKQSDLVEKTEVLNNEVDRANQAAVNEQLIREQKEDAIQKEVYEKAQKIKNIKEHIDTYVEHRVNFSYDPTFGGINNVSVTVGNNSDFKLEEVTVTLLYIKKNGDLHDSKNVTLYNIPPHSVKTTLAPSSGRGTSMDSKITAFQLDEG